MADLTNAKYVFLSSVRQGAASDIQTPDSLGANQPGIVSVSVKLRVNDRPDIEKQVRLFGPGDITGIDPQQVIRTEPRHLATDFEPNYFPFVEFDRPDFPWLFTPAKANSAGKLRPWICLVVVRKQDGVELRVDRNLPLPILNSPKHELPDLSDSWAWAHAQVTGSELNSDVLEKALAGDPALTLSRLVCPRRLDPKTDYLACVVPAFELGRKAGLGLPIDPKEEQSPLEPIAGSEHPSLGLTPAWTLGEQSPSQVTLPVYYHWEFRTGTGNDFEELVRLLEPRKMPKKVGKRPIDISQPGFKITPVLDPGTTLEFEGALRVKEEPPTEETPPDEPPANTAQPIDWSDAIRTSFQNALKSILDAPWQALKDGKEPLLAPPIYGCWQAARHTVNVPPVASEYQTWLDDLNLDPRHRAVAALGTQVVQSQQEQLMAAAWEQLGEIQRINQILRQAQFARVVNGVYYAKHLNKFSEEALLKAVATAQSRVVIQTTDQSRALLSHTIAQSALPIRAISAPMRRLTSPRAGISARFKAVGVPPSALVTRLNTTTPIVSFQRKPAGWTTINRVSSDATGGMNQLVLFERTLVTLDTAPPLSNFKVSPEFNGFTLLDFMRGTMNDEEQAFLNAARAHQIYINQKVFGLIWQNAKFVFSGGDSIIYGVDHVGRLLFYRDKTQDGTGDGNIPSMIGRGGWLPFKFLFSGGNGIIYAVNQQGSLLFYRDKNQDGTGDVADHKVIGQNGWQNFKFLFSGGNGIIYAVDELGRLLFSRDKTQDGTGEVTNPTVIGRGGWLPFKFLFSGGNGIIYAVNQQGSLLFYRDKNQDGTGDVADHKVIGQNGWQNFKFLFSGGNGIIYAVDEQGRLLTSRDVKQDGTGIVPTPSVIGQGGAISPSLPIDLAMTKNVVMQSINPEKTIKARVQASLKLDSGVERTGDPLEPLLNAPEFPQPMYEALRDLSQDFLFPGLEHVVPNTVTLLETNSKFIESFLVGLNAGMSHELLWRGYPTDQRGTYFRQFWEPVDKKDPYDIEPIKDWGDDRLGKNVNSGEQLVLLLRGELLRRYPNSVIYAVKATKTNRLSDEERFPVFRGTLKPDVTFLGFDLTRDEVLGNESLGDPGWYFVIQEQPTEPRFGMDAAKFSEPLPELTTWNNLSWRHLANTEEELKALAYFSIEKVKTALPVTVINTVEWGKNAAHQANITWQRPVRIAIHARNLIP